MENAINKILTAFRTYSTQILSNKAGKGDDVAEVTNSNTTEAANSDTTAVLSKNRMKYSVNDKDKIVVQVIRDKTGKIIRTIPLSEQHALDIFE